MRPPRTDIHAFQHGLIDERIPEYRAAIRKLRGKKNTRARYQFYLRAATTLRGHIERFHGYHKTIGMPPSVDDLEMYHARAHGGDDKAAWTVR
jgi:hypothetical protein